MSAEMTTEPQEPPEKKSETVTVYSVAEPSTSTDMLKDSYVKVNSN